MMDAWKTLVNVNKGQDAYSVIGEYIMDHVTAIENMIAVIQINGVIIKELYMVDVDVDGYFYWKSDWWEGEEDVALLDFFPVSDAERIKWVPCSERLPVKDGDYIVTYEKGYASDYGLDPIGIAPFEVDCEGFGSWQEDFDMHTLGSLGTEWVDINVIAWMPLPNCYQGDEK